MKFERLQADELTNLEECMCHALTSAHAAIQMLSETLAARGLIDAADLAAIHRLTDADRRSVIAVEGHPIAAHGRPSLEEALAALLTEDRLIDCAPRGSFG